MIICINMDYCQLNFKNYFDYLSDCLEETMTVGAALTDDEIVLEEYFGSGCEYGSGDRQSLDLDSTKSASVTVTTESFDTITTSTSTTVAVTSGSTTVVTTGPVTTAPVTTAPDTTVPFTTAPVITSVVWPIEPKIFWPIVGFGIFGWIILVLVSFYIYKKRRRYSPRSFVQNYYTPATLAPRETEV